MEKEKEHENELFNTIQKFNVIKELEVEELQKEMQQLKDLMEREKSINN